MFLFIAADKWVPPDTPVDPTVKCNLDLDLILLINSPVNMLDTEFTLLKYRLVNFIDRLVHSLETTSDLNRWFSYLPWRA